MNNKNPLIISFSDIRSIDLPLVGGKGANLGEMTHAGFPVPDGFCLTTNAFQQFIDSYPNSDDLYKQLDKLTSDDLEEVRATGEHIRQSLLKVPIPGVIAKEITCEWRETGINHTYAIRSSATAEDLPDASFAGQQDTYLNIKGESDLLNAIRKCWVSLFSDRAILYRIQNGYNHHDVQLSVVVQQMIDSDASGVLFTADPMSGNRQTLTIDASFGLGEALVSGIVSPDNYRVSKKDNNILDRQIAEKKIGVFPQKEGGTRQAKLSRELREQVVLSDTQILSLAELGSKVEAHYGTPQDIEWAIKDGQFYLLQTRPITSLYPIDGLKSPDESLQVYLSLGHQQSMMDAMSPLGLSTIQVMMPVGHEDDKFDNSVIRLSGGRMFANLTSLLRHSILRRGMFALLSQLDVLAPEAAKKVMKSSDFKRPHGMRLKRASITLVLKIIKRVIGALLRKDLTGFVDQTNELMDQFITEVTESLQLKPPGKEQLQAVFDAFPEFFPFFLNWVPETAAGIASARIITRLAKRWLYPYQLNALTLGIPGNVVNEMNLAIGDLGDLARSSLPLMEHFGNLGEDGNEWIEKAKEFEGSGPFINAWEDFLSKYGTRGPSEIDIRRKRWYEEPQPVLRVIACLLNNDEGAHREHYQELRKRRISVFEQLQESAGSGLLGNIRLRLLKRLYHVMTEVGGMREHHKFMIIRLLAVIKEILKKNAEYFLEQGRIKRLDDIWFLNWKELLNIQDMDDSDLQEIISERRIDLERYEKLTPPLIITSDGEAPSVRYQVKDAPEGALLGNPVSPGVVEGVVRVIRDPQTEFLAPGEILVAEFTDPGWTPLFINASGLIMEVGGALTHGAVVAREYGIPAIVGVKEATRILRTGQKVRVDGNRGIIEEI